MTKEALQKGLGLCIIVFGISLGGIGHSAAVWMPEAHRPVDPAYLMHFAEAMGISCGIATTLGLYVFIEKPRRFQFLFEKYRSFLERSGD